MPAYEVEHVVPLSSQQKDGIAQSITATHTSLFTTPSLFVNVRFIDIADQDIYVGGKKVAFSVARQHVARLMSVRNGQIASLHMSGLVEVAPVHSSTSSVPD